ncbi:MAG TPA: alpha/beta hydrolase [Bryobacteraceae bacterium]|nr:alpha/beta hydrolase [Bryobacteraceae bacterium]
MKKLLWSVGIIVVVLAAGAALMWWWIGRPMYEPGDVRAGRDLGAPLDPPPQDTEGVWTVEPQIRLRTFSSGTGQNVLFVHGGPGFPATEPYAGFEALKNELRVHYYDQRGSGKSTRPFDRFTASSYGANMKQLEGTLGIGAQIADIERIRRILGEDKLMLVGHSWGGLLAALYAAEFPERVAKLVLIAPASMLVMPSPEGDFFQTVRAKLPEARRAEFDAWQKQYFDFGGLFDKNEKQLAALHADFGRFYQEAAGNTAAEMPADGGGWMVWAQYLSLGRRHDWRDALRKVSAPVLVLHGAADLQPEAASRTYATAFPNGRLEVLKGCGHFPQAQCPEAFAEAVGRFLR